MTSTVTNADDVRDRVATDPQDVLCLLAQQRDLYRELRALADRQRSTVTASEPEILLGVLAERQKVVERIARLNVRVREARASWPALHGAMTTAQRKAAGDMIAEVQTTLAEILAGDERDARTLSARMALVKDESAAVANARQAHAAYGTTALAGGATYAPPRFIDQTDEQA